MLTVETRPAPMAKVQHNKRDREIRMKITRVQAKSTALERIQLAQHPTHKLPTTYKVLFKSLRRSA